jgi:hypothetical protein
MSRSLSRALAAVFVLVMLVLFVACRLKATPGGKCTTNGRAMCFATDSALLCRNNVFVTIPCKGPHGCKQMGAGGDVNCDDDLADENDPCMGSLNENYACSKDHKKALVCKDDKFQLWRACRGPKACAIHGTTVECDTNMQEAGDPCGTPGTYACSVDHKMILKCVDDKLMQDNSCRGPDECRVDALANKVKCDDRMALEGDPCDTPDEVACEAATGKSRLTCKSHKYVLDKLCKRHDGCQWNRGEAAPRCDW